MTEREFEAKLKELDRLLNDPEVQMDAHRVWSLLAELSEPQATTLPTSARVGAGARAAAAATASASAATPTIN